MIRYIYWFYYSVSVIVVKNITEVIPTVPPSLMGIFDKKDYTVILGNLGTAPLGNIKELRLYLGCYKKNSISTVMSNCRLSVITNHNHIYSAIEPINPESNDRADVLRYIIADEVLNDLLTTNTDIKIRVQVETSQDDAIPRTTPGSYVLKAHIEYTAGTTKSNNTINIDVS